MLVLTRKKNEQLLIGDNVIVRVVSITPTVVKLAVEAPREVRILRAEVADNNNEQGEKNGDGNEAA